MYIEIRFRRSHSGHDETLVLSPEEYFDPIGMTETYEEHGIPRRMNLYEYIGVEPRNLDNIYLSIYTDTEKSIKTGGQATYYYSNGGIEVTTVAWNDSNSAFAAEEIIVSTEIRPNKTHIIRLRRPASGRGWELKLDSIVTVHDHGPDTHEDLMESPTRNSQRGRSGMPPT